MKAFYLGFVITFALGSMPAHTTCRCRAPGYPDCVNANDEATCHDFVQGPAECGVAYRGYCEYGGGSY